MLRSGRLVSVDAHHFRVFRRIYYWHFLPVLPRAGFLVVLGYSLSRSWDSSIDVTVSRRVINTLASISAVPMLAFISLTSWWGCLPNPCSPIGWDYLDERLTKMAKNTTADSLIALIHLEVAKQGLRTLSKFDSRRGWLMETKEVVVR